jgi:methylglutaconyl-CoA hydratase
MLRSLARAFSAQPLFLSQPASRNPLVRELVLSSPHNKNSLSQQLLNEMETTFAQLRDSRDIRAAILKSACDNVFCAGANLKERLAMTVEETDVLVQQIRRVFHAVYHLPFPVLCVIDGFALGGGLELALNADIRIVTKRSTLGLV